MQPTERADIERWVAAWQRAHGPLERLQREELRQIDTMRAAAELAGAFAHVPAHAVPEEHSGLVEQQRLFRALAR